MFKELPSVSKVNISSDGWLSWLVPKDGVNKDSELLVLWKQSGSETVKGGAWVFWLTVKGKVGL